MILQGVGYLLSDPQLHSLPGDYRFGRGNFNEEGMKNFFSVCWLVGNGLLSTWKRRRTAATSSARAWV